MQTHETRINNDLAALRFVHLFGFLRIVELGTLMKPHTATSLEAGARLARSLIERHLVLSRRLPEGAGQALVLATGGVRLLAEHGIHAASGKSIGQTVCEHWIPPATWKHDLLAHGVLSELFRRGYQVIPEAEIRRRAGSIAKLPDGLVRAPGNEGTWHWLEVENARKSGPNMKRLADAITAVSARQVEVCGIRPIGCMLVFWRNSVDERGHRLNHRDRVSKAVASIARSDVRLTLLECTRKGAAGVADITLTDTTVAADRASAILKRLDANGWQPDGETGQKTQYGAYMAYVWQDTDAPGTWSYHAEGNGWSGVAGYATGIREAKRGAAGLIASR